MARLRFENLIRPHYVNYLIYVEGRKFRAIELDDLAEKAVAWLYENIDEDGHFDVKAFSKLFGKEIIEEFLEAGIIELEVEEARQIEVETRK